MAELTPDAGDADSDVFREVIGHFMTGVTVITTSSDGEDFGMSASAVSSLSLEPPMVLVCVNAATPTRSAISESRRFCVNVLAEDQHHLALQFAKPSEDKFAGVATAAGDLGVPVLTDALATLECEVDDDVRGGTHSIFLGRVKRAKARDGSPLAYFRGGFGSLQITANARAYEVIRQLVMERTVSLDTPMDIPTLEQDLQLPGSQIYHALVKLEAEGLVVRDDHNQFVVSPVDRLISEDAFEAACAIETGVAQATVLSASDERVAELRRHMEATDDLIADGHFTDVPKYVEANMAFHEYMVGLAGSSSLLAAYRRLSIPTIMARLFSHYDVADPQLVRDHRELVEAYEMKSVAAAVHVIRGHSERARSTNNAAIEAGGGRI